MSNDLQNLYRQAEYGGFRFQLLADKRYEKEIHRKSIIHQYLGDGNLLQDVGQAPTMYTLEMYIFPDQSLTTAVDIQKDIENKTQFFEQVLNNPIQQALQLPDRPPFYAIPDFSKGIVSCIYPGYTTIKATFTDALTTLQQLTLSDNALEEQTNLVQTKASSFWSNVLSFKDSTFTKLQQFQGQIEIFSADANGIISNAYQISEVVSNTANALNLIIANANNVTAAIKTLQSTTTIILSTPSTVFNNLNNVFTNIITAFATPTSQIDALLTFNNFGSTDLPITNQSSTAQGILQNRNIVNVTIQILALINIYNIAPSIDFITKAQILQLEEMTDNMFYNIINVNIDIYNDLFILRNLFKDTMQNLLNIAVQTQIINVPFPRNLYDIMYQWNGNFDYYDQTILINNILNPAVVQGQIEILLNADA